MAAAVEHSLGNLATVLRTKGREILADWEITLRASSHDNAPELVDHIPEALQQIAAVVEQRTDPSAGPQLRDGFDLPAVISEYAVLRQSIISVWVATGAPLEPAEFLLLARAFDRLIANAVEAHDHFLHELQGLADNIPQLTWMADEKGWIYWYNRRWFDYTGRSLDEMRGWGWQAVHHPKHLQSVVEKFRSSIATGSPWEDTFPLRGKDGRYRWFLSRALPIRGADGSIERWFGSKTDLTNQRLLDTATTLLTSSLDSDEALQRFSDTVIEDFADWCIVDLLEEEALRRVAAAHSDPARATLALNAPDLTMRRHLADAIVRGEPTLVKNITDEALRWHAANEERFQELRRLAPVSAIIVPLVARDKPIGALSLVMSESGRRYDEKDLAVAIELGRRVGVAIENARLLREVQESVTSREQMLAVVSHDLRNPLNTIDLGASILLNEAAEPRARNHLEAIRRSVNYMERLIGDLLDMASINARRLALQRSRIAANLLVREVVDAQEALATEREIAILRETDVEGVVLDCDRNRLEQVFGNVIGNALKFCRPGDTITVRARRVEHRIEIEIADTGPGIPKDELPHLFEPYWSGRKGKKLGTGLGLYIADGIVRAHGGTITAWSEGRGATFVISLPIAHDIPEAAR